MIDQAVVGLDFHAKAAKAIDAAAWAAVRKARQTGTNLVVWENGQTIEITPDQAEAQMLAEGMTPDLRRVLS